LSSRPFSSVHRLTPWSGAAVSLLAALWFVAGALDVPLPAGAQVSTGATQSDVQFAAPAGVPLAMDVYRPSGAGPFAAVVVLHPGGFVKGDKADQQVVTVAQDLAQAGFEAFTVNYRLAPEFHYPAPVQDVQSAVSYIREHAGQFNVDPSRIAAFGGSAGGTLAAAVGDEGTGSLCSGTRVVAVVTWSGALDLNQIVTEQIGGADAIEEYAGVLGAHHRQLIGPADATAAVIKASAITYLDKTDPPQFVANSQHEFMPLDQALEYLNKLKRLHIPNAFFSRPAGGHAFDYTAFAIQPTIDFLNTYLKAAKCVASSPKPSSSPHPTSSPTIGQGGNGNADGSPSPSSHSSVPVIPIAAAAAGAILLVGLLMWLAARRRNSPYRR